MVVNTLSCDLGPSAPASLHFTPPASMHKSKVESFRALILCVVDVVDLLFTSELRPGFFPPLVALNVIVLDEEE